MSRSAHSQLQAVIDVVAAADDTAIGEIDRFRVLLVQCGHPGARLASHELIELHEFADSIRDVFAASPVERVELVNRLLSDVSTPLALIDMPGSGVELSVRHDEPTLRSVLDHHICAVAVATTTLSQRLRLCDADDCGDVFVDATKNNSARFCSTTCSNRQHGRQRRRR